jgi:hypothetical protein
MQISIIPVDGAVYKDGYSYSKLPMLEVPSTVHALQFNSDVEAGWIEYNNGLPNEAITQLPQWAVDLCALWDTLKSKEKTVIEEVDGEPLTTAQLEAIIIDDRNKRLAASDWTQLPDVLALHDDVWAINWKTYRQALRDLTLNMDVNNPIFPVPPL